MDNKRKEYIDSLWMNTQYGRFVLAAAEGKNEEAKRIQNEIFQEYPYFVSTAGEILAEELKKELKPGEFKEYIKKLEKDNYNLLEYMISHCGMFDTLITY